MSVFLTPDLQPFYGGTYYPPRDAYGRPGLISQQAPEGDLRCTPGQLQAVLDAHPPRAGWPRGHLGGPGTEMCATQ